MARDFSAEMNEYIRARIPAGDYVAPATAIAIVRSLEEHDPDLLAGWLMLRAPQLITAHIRGMRAKQRAAARRPRPNAFAEAARKFGQGERGALDDWLARTKHHLQDNVIRSLGDMTGPDCEYAASAYRREAGTLNAEALFLEVLARKAGDRKVRDVVSPAEARRLREQIRRQLEASAASVA
jgi:hypothetical protein